MRERCCISPAHRGSLDGGLERIGGTCRRRKTWNPRFLSAAGFPQRRFRKGISTAVFRDGFSKARKALEQGSQGFGRK
jgi:hypothetical protein